MLRWGVVIVVLLPLAAAQSTQDLDIESHDGTQLNARLHFPEGDGPWPAILLTHGWGESIDSGTTRTFSQHFQDLGYLVLSYDSRGFGQSGGQVELDGPNEVQDAMGLIDWLAARPDVILDAPGDPRVGMVGQSYAGGIQILTAAQDPRIDAIAPFATWSNLLASLAPNDVLKRGWIDLLYASGTTSSRGIPLGGTDPSAYDPDPLGGTSAKLDEWYALSTATGSAPDEMRHELGVVRSLVPGAVNAPTFLAQGWPDTLFTPDHALATFQELRGRGVDARLALFHGGHGGFGAYATTEAVMAALSDFMAQHLQDAHPSLPPYPVLRYRYHSDDFVGEMTWPPVGTQYQLLHLTDDGLQQTEGPFSAKLAVPVIPTQCTEISNFQSQTAAYCGQGIPGTRLDLESEPLEDAREVTGTPYLRLQVDTTQTRELFLFFHLSDVAPDGSATPVLGHVMPIRVPAATPEVLLPLATVTHLFPAGHRIALTITTTDLTYHGAREPGQVTLGGQGDVLMLPFVPQDAWGDRIPPTIVRLQSFADVVGDQAMRFRVSDDLGIGNITAHASAGNVTITTAGTVQSRVVELRANAPCGTATITLIVADLAGNEAERTFDVAACPSPPEAPTLGPDEKQKKAPLPLLLLPLLVAAAARRR